MPGKIFYIGSDYGGFELKQKISEFLRDEGYKINDEGASFYKEKDDYPDYAEKVAKKVMEKKGRGILICTSGHGMAIASNKLPGIRASVCWSKESAKVAKEHDDINILCLPADFVTSETAKKIVKTWIDTKFPRLQRRLRRQEKIKKIEKKY